MTLTLRETLASLYGAWRLAMLDARGLDYFDRSPEGALRSFWVAVLASPGYLVLYLLSPPEMAESAGMGRYLLVQSIGYVVFWTAFPVVMHPVSGLIDRADRYPGYICAYNWASLVQTAVYLPVLIFAESGLVPPGAAGIPLAVISAAMLVYQWFVAKAGLKIGGAAAAGIVFLDLVVVLFVSGIAEGLTGGT